MDLEFEYKLFHEILVVGAGGHSFSISRFVTTYMHIDAAVKSHKGKPIPKIIRHTTTLCVYLHAIMAVNIIC